MEQAHSTNSNNQQATLEAQL